MGKIMNNIVPKDIMREIQIKTLGELSDILKNSFGPYGSNACIKKENAFSRYSKDGHTIIGALHYNGIIEQSIKDDIESITRHIVKTVGDGTTSAVLLSNLIFNSFQKIEKDNYQPAIIIDTLTKIVDNIKGEILKTAKPLNLEDVYDIAMISTNGNKYISETIKKIYEEFGNSVFIDVYPSIGEEIVIKSYNGMTLNTGYCDSCYVTNQTNNTAEVDHPEVYFFEHPIDTREIGVYLDAILSRNIVTPARDNDWNNIVPTVIFAPKISQDMSSLMDTVTNFMVNTPANNRLPICIITDYHEVAQLTDLATMCGAKMIRKYIDPKIYEEDVKSGIAPTPETIFNWAGRCDKVVSYSDKTTFIRPERMYDENGEFSNVYNNLLSFLETEISKATDDGEDARTIGTLKRRLHSLKSNLVELYVGGITQADRDALRDLVEDAVLNIRSAAVNGVGLGANMTASMVICKINNRRDDSDEDYNSLESALYAAIENAYMGLASILFEGFNIEKQGESLFATLVWEAEHGNVFNIREQLWTDNVKTSIMSDITILDTVCRIIGIMATCNQFILPTAMHNVYVD